MNWPDWLKSRRALAQERDAAYASELTIAAYWEGARNEVAVLEGRLREAERRLATVARCAHGHVHVTVGQATACAARSPEDMARIRALTEGEA